MTAKPLQGMPKFVLEPRGVFHHLEIITGYLGTGAFLPILLASILSLTLSFTRSLQLRKAEVITWLVQTETQNNALWPCLFFLFLSNCQTFHRVSSSLCQLLPDLIDSLQTWTLTQATFKTNHKIHLMPTNK